MSFSTFFLAEQRAFLRRRTREWRHHLNRIQAHIGQSLEAAPRDRPVLILGAGSGLEIPWRLAPQDTTGWDLDPTSRLRTFLRRGRWPDWVFSDFTSALEPFQQAVLRSVHQGWWGRRREPALAARRLAGLLASLDPWPTALEAWIHQRQPGLIVGANWMGQLGVTAQRILEKAFLPASPWEEDPERPDPLAEALDQWVRRILAKHLEVLARSGSDLCLVYDRGVSLGKIPLSLGPFQPGWVQQLRAPAPLTLSDPLSGFNPVEALPDSTSCDRWLWSLTPERCHVMEALRWTSKFHQDSQNTLE